jgi:ubiquinone/menaquinone biosynthesis C-methylase UbiE
MSTTENRSPGNSIDVEAAVRQRYSQASQNVVPDLCCPVQYDQQYLKLLPAEIIERDYGCGDPSRYVRSGETVLDLGSGGGKICYIASQIVGPEGHVHGVDVNDDMLELARKYQSQLSQKIGWDNVTFHKAKIQDLQLDLQKLDDYLAAHPAQNLSGWQSAESHAQQLRETAPVIANDSIDVVLSNCVLNLVREADRRQLFREIFRVLKRGGRAVISDIVSDEPVPESLKNDPTLWSGCISGAFVEDEFLRAFEAAGFYGIEIMARQSEPWAVVNGIEFRSMTLQAFKGKEGSCLDYHQAVVYKGPWKSVTDDEGHVLQRGIRTAVCKRTFELYTGAPYAEQVTPIEPAEAVTQPREFDCTQGEVRDPRVTKQQSKQASASINILPAEDCCSGDSCC